MTNKKRALPGLVLLASLALAFAPMTAAQDGLGIHATADGQIVQQATGACPAMTAHVQDNGDVRLEFQALSQATVLLRSTGNSLPVGGEAIALLSAGATSFTDAAAQGFATYHYALQVGGTTCASIAIHVDLCPLLDFASATTAQVSALAASAGVDLSAVLGMCGAPGGDDPQANGSVSGSDDTPEDGSNNGTEDAYDGSDGGADDGDAGGSNGTDAGAGDDNEVEANVPDPANLCPSVIADVQDDGEVVLTFDALADSAVMMRATNGIPAAGNTIAQLPAGATSFTDAHVNAFLAYYYALQVGGQQCASLVVDVDLCLLVDVVNDTTAHISEVAANFGLDAEAMVGLCGLQVDDDDDDDTVVNVCPTLHATTSGEGNIALHIDNLTQQATLLRQASGAAPEAMAIVEAGQTIVTDADTDVGVTYVYSLLIDGKPCAAVEVTHMPVFGTVVAGGLAIGLSLLGYAGYRRFL